LNQTVELLKGCLGGPSSFDAARTLHCFVLVYVVDEDHHRITALAAVDRNLGGCARLQFQPAFKRLDADSKLSMELFAVVYDCLEPLHCLPIACWHPCMNCWSSPHD
jgi:hypothetical protein